MPYVTVDVDLDEFTDHELIEELALRNIENFASKEQTSKYELFSKYVDRFSYIELQMMFEQNEPVIAGKNQLKLAI